MIRLLLMAALSSFCLNAAPAGKTRNVIVVMTDGLRWQEVFAGADEGWRIRKSFARSSGGRVPPRAARR
jgi:hypothetical protein